MEAIGTEIKVLTPQFVHGKYFPRKDSGPRLVSIIDWQGKPSVLKEVVLTQGEATADYEMQAVTGISAYLSQHQLSPVDRRLILPHTWGIQKSSQWPALESAYFVRDYHEGRDLKVVPDTEIARLPAETALVFFNDVYTAAETARAAGFVFQDLEPNNILVTPEWRGLVYDFGGCRAIEKYIGEVISDRRIWEALPKNRRDEDAYPLAWAIDVDQLFRVARSLGAPKQGMAIQDYALEASEIIDAYYEREGREFSLGDINKFRDLMTQIALGEYKAN